MNKPALEDFYLTQARLEEFQHKETYFYSKDRKERSSDRLTIFFWISVFSGLPLASGKSDNAVLLLIAVVSGLLFFILFIGKLFDNPVSSPALPQNYKDYKNAIHKYDSFLREKEHQQKIIEKERQSEEMAHKRKTYEYWTTVDPYQFEHEVATLFQNHGFDVKVTKGSGDQGIDIKLFKNGKRGAVQCKRYTTKVGPGAARDFWGAMMHGEYDFGFIVCPSSFYKEETHNPYRT